MRARSDDDARGELVGLDLLVRQHHGTVDVDLVLARDVLAEDGHVLDPSPLADLAAPPDDAAGDARVLADHARRKDHAVLKKRERKRDKERERGGGREGKKRKEGVARARACQEPCASVGVCACVREGIP